MQDDELVAIFFSCKFSPAELILNCLEALSIIFLQVQLALLYITLRSIDRQLMIQWRLLCSKRTSLDSCSIASKSRLIGLGSDYYWCIWGYFKVSIQHVTSRESQLINKNMNHYNPLESQFSRFNLTKKVTPPSHQRVYFIICVDSNPQVSASPFSTRRRIKEKDMQFV